MLKFTVEPKRVDGDGDVETCPPRHAQFWGVYAKPWHRDVKAFGPAMHVADYSKKTTAQTVRSTLARFERERGQTPEDKVADLLTAVFLFAHAHGVDTELCLRRARGHAEAEISGECWRDNT